MNRATAASDPLLPGIAISSMTSRRARAKSGSMLLEIYHAGAPYAILC